MRDTVAASLGNPLSALLGEQLSTCRCRMHHTVLYSLEQNALRYPLCKHENQIKSHVFQSVTQGCPFIPGFAFYDI